VNIVKGLTRTRYLLGAFLAVLIIGCGEQRATGPERAKLAMAPTFTVVSDFTTYGDGGKVSSVGQSAQQLTAVVRGGIARATFAKQLKSYTVDGGVTSDGIVLTPVVGVVTGGLALNYDETTIDSLGNQLHTVGTGPSDGSPVTEAWSYVNGTLVSYEYSYWNAVSGGHVLSLQVLNGYSPAGSLVATISSKLSGTSQQLLTSRSFTGKFADALTRVACALAPKVAYAYVPACTKQGLVFLGETVVLGAASTEPITYAWAYLTGWGLWTAGLYDFLNCLNGAGGGKLRKATLQ